MIRFLLAFLLSSSAWANSRLPKDALTFTYQPDNSLSVTCEHQQLRDLPDWTVWCKDKSHNKEFSVHLVLYKSLSKEGRTRYEVLYWVTDRLTPRKREYHGTSMFFTFKGDATGEVIRIGQMVNKGIAHLNLEIRL